MKLALCKSKHLLSLRGVCHVNFYRIAEHNFFKTNSFADLVNLGGSKLHNLFWTEIFKIEGLIVPYSLFAPSSHSFSCASSLGVELSRKEQKKRRRTSVDRLRSTRTP